MSPPPPGKRPQSDWRFTRCSHRRANDVADKNERALHWPGFLALLGAWLATWRGGPVLGLSEEHLFRDATVLTLVGVAFLVDALVHERIG